MSAVGEAPQHAGQHVHMQYEYANGTSVRDDDNSDHDIHAHAHLMGHGDDPMDRDMEEYYTQQDYQNLQAQQNVYNQHMGQYHNDDDGDMDDDEMYSDESSEESILPDENIDFSLVYAL